MIHRCRSDFPAHPAPHPSRVLPCLLVAATAALAGATSALAERIVIEYPTPSLDRWNYPFNPTPGSRITASTFGNEAGSALFDNRDGQFVVGFSTAADVPAGLGVASYSIASCVLEVTIANDLVATYDDSVDSFAAFLPVADPAYSDDADPGQPIEVYGTGYRNGFSVATWVENTPFAPGGTSLLAPGVRSAFPLARNAAGTWVDASNHVRERWTPVPFAVGRIEGLEPGERIPLGSVVRFELEAGRADVQEFLREALNAGRLRLTVTSPTKVVQQGGEFPTFYCRENPIVAATGIGGARLRLDLNVGPTCEAADLDCDGSVGAADLAALLAAWGSAGTADLDGDGSVGATDLAALLAAWG